MKMAFFCLPGCICGLIHFGQAKKLVLLECGIMQSCYERVAT